MNSGARSAGDVARMLGVSVPTVRRVANRLHLVTTLTAGGHRRFSAAQVAQLSEELGVVPRVRGLSRVQTRVLAALASHPLGFTSARSVARVAGVSAASAIAALAMLESEGFASVTDVVLADGGRARRGRRWRLRVGPHWAAIAPVVAKTVLPRAEPHRSAGIPRRFWHLFWNVDVRELDLGRDARFIATRALLSGNLAAKSWALSSLPPEALAAAAANRAADDRLRAMVANSLAASARA